jgi:hypothetical protein
MKVHTYNPSTQEAEAEVLHSEWVLGQPGLQNKTVSQKKGEVSGDIAQWNSAYLAGLRPWVGHG